MDEARENQEAGDRLTRIALGTVAFLLACGAVVAVEALIVWAITAMTHRSIMPRGLGWIVLPIVAGIAGYRISSGWSAEKVVAIFGTSRQVRLVAAGIGSWWLAVAAYWVIAQPYGYRMYWVDWLDLFKLLIIPSIAGSLAWLLFRWANAQR